MGKKFLGLGGTDHFWDRAKAWILNQITSAVAAKIAEVVANAPEDLDTLKEIADWISTHADDAAAMNTQITENKNNIATNTSDISALKTSVAGKADKLHTHSAGDIASGTLPIANGGTGATTALGAFESLANGLPEGAGPLDTEHIIFQNENRKNWGLYTLSQFWEYIKGKISSVLGLTKDNYGGKASTAGTADTVDNYHASDLWRSDGATWNPSANVTMTPSGNEQEWSFDFRNKNGAAGSYWQVWDENKQTLLRVNADDGKVSAPYGFVGNLSGKADTAGTADKSDRTTGITYTGENSSCISAQQTPESFNNSSADWASYIICNHGNGTTYYHQMLRLPFFSDTIQLQRRVDGELKGWKNVAIMENENTWSGRQNFTTAKASNKMVIPIGAPSSLEDGCIWIER